MLAFLAHYIIQLIESSSYLGIFILMFLESALIPIPSEVTMPFSGFLAAQGKLSFWAVVIAGTLANLSGSLLAYFVGYYLEENVLVKFISKYGKFILVTPHDYDKAKGWFEKYGDKIIFASRLLPAVRTVISLPAGVFEMDLKKFILYTVVGCFIWSTILTYIGFKLGENWNSLEVYFSKFQTAIIVLIVIGIIYFVYRKLGLKKKVN